MYFQRIQTSTQGSSKHTEEIYTFICIFFKKVKLWRGSLHFSSEFETTIQENVYIWDRHQIKIFYVMNNGFDRGELLLEALLEYVKMGKRLHNFKKCNL